MNVEVIKQQLQRTKEFSVLQTIEDLEKENQELKGYRDVIESLKAEGFDSVMSIKEFMQDQKAETERLEAKLVEANNRSIRYLHECAQAEKRLREAEAK